MTAIILTLVSVTPMGGALNRLVLSSPELTSERIPAFFAGLHIKLFFKQPHQAELVLPQRDENDKIVWPEADKKPLARTYSIADFDAENHTITVDFVLHRDYGIASEFAKLAKPGDRLGFAGPGLITMVNPSAEQHLLVGDLSAMPAIAAVLNTLTLKDSVRVIIELERSVDQTLITQQYFAAREHQVTFVEQKFTDKSEILELVRNLQISNTKDQWSIALAGEHLTVVSIRKYLRQIDFDKKSLYAVPYWRNQQNEETYHAQRHEVMDT
ncbi:siderophore-interacting protein [uncultured Paraglaciecola sp.]|uniref:siderophore-interacting protein n=1 Tax=uncultured Paraglaciecola sp. TaxID=1765024 RepID=UPI00259ABD24|nr:siderophore-interacting protein [uncultured Paraglaciecola sp.]